MRRLFQLLICIAQVTWMPVADAAPIVELHEAQLSNGVRIEYLIARPEHFHADRFVPALLVFPGGKQTIESVRAGLDRYWLGEAIRRGYLVISPAAPPGLPFYENGAELIPEFLRQQLAQFRIEGEKFHVAGLSNGGVSAFVAATRAPTLFRSLTVLAGYPVDPFDFDNLDQLRGIKISMFVGELDNFWKDGMERARDRLQLLGIPVHFEEVPGNGHLLPGLSFGNSRRIFKHMPSGVDLVTGGK